MLRSAAFHHDRRRSLALPTLAYSSGYSDLAFLRRGPWPPVLRPVPGPSVSQVPVMELPWT